MKRITFRKAADSYGRDVECSYGGVKVGSISMSVYGWYWVVYGDRIGIEVKNSLWDNLAFPFLEAAKADCKRYILSQLKLLETK